MGFGGGIGGNAVGFNPLATGFNPNAPVEEATKGGHCEFASRMRMQRDVFRQEYAQNLGSSARSGYGGGGRSYHRSAPKGGTRSARSIVGKSLQREPSSACRGSRGTGRSKEKRTSLSASFGRFVSAPKTRSLSRASEQSKGRSKGFSPLSLEEQLKNFVEILRSGQVFTRHSEDHRKGKQRVLSVTFDASRKPKQISCGSKRIEFADILYIAWGHWTPVFQSRKNELTEKLCFSIVAKHAILDFEAESAQIAELWVKALRKLIGHSDEKSDAMAKEALQGGTFPSMDEKEKAKGKKRFGGLFGV